MATVAAHPNAVTIPAAFLTGGRETYRLSRGATLGIWAFGLSMLLVCLGSSRVLTYHEIVFAQPAKEMLATGNFVLPKIAGVPFTDKPPLTAWMIALSMFVFQSTAEWVVRLPSVLAAIGTSWIIAAVAARWFGNRLGWLSGLMHLTTVHVSMQARLAEADTLLALTVAGAIALFGLSQVEGPGGKLTGRWIPWAFHACLALSFLAKFMAGPAFIVAGCGLFALVQRDVRSALRIFFNPLGLLIFTLMTAPWLVAAYLQYPAWLDNVLAHNFGRFGGSLGKNEPAWAYLYLVPLMMLPWTPLAIGAAWHGIARGLHHDRRWQLLGCWFLGGMALLSLMAFKTKHYTIPALTPLAVLSAAGLNSFLHWRQRVKWKGTWLWALVVIGFAAGVRQFLPQLLHRLPYQETDAIEAIVVIAAAAALALLLAELRGSLRGQIAVLFGIAWFVSVGTQAAVIPFHDSYRHQTRFANRVNGFFHGEDPDLQSPLLGGLRILYMVALPDNQVTFYLENWLQRFDEPTDFIRHSAQYAGDRVYVLGPARLKKMLGEHGTAKVIRECGQVNRYQTWDDRLTLFVYRPAP